MPNNEDGAYFPNWGASFLPIYYWEGFVKPLGAAYVKSVFETYLFGIYKSF